MKIEKVIISGGGTGGHIYPAIAIANEIKNRFSDAEILFVGALGRMEMEKVPEQGYNIIGLPVTGMPRKPGLEMITFFWNLLKSSIKAKKIIKKFNPQIVIGVGGFASAPILRAAGCKKIPTVIQEQNSYAGIANKLLAKKAKTICVAYNNMERYFPKDKIVLTGNPVRNNLEILSENIQEAIDYFGVKLGKKVILIVGGSLGARSINNAVLNNIRYIKETDVEFIWQTGSIYYKEIMSKMRDKTPSNLHIHEFLKRMDLAYAVADVVISRAGAGTVSELSLVRKPVVLVPSPNVAEDHQTMNAKALTEKEAALMVKDSEINEKLLQCAVDLVNNEEECEKFSNNIKMFAKPLATKQIVDEVEKLLK